jgi:L-lactate dehydrogenase
MLGTHWGIDVHNVHGYVLGEHGDTEFVAWSLAHIAGMPVDTYAATAGRSAEWPAERKRIEDAVRDSAYHIIDYKGATSFAVGLALVRITAAILRGQKSMLTVSAMLDGEFGLRNVCLGVPCVVSSEGIETIVQSRLPERELAALHSSAAILRQAIKDTETET